MLSNEVFALACRAYYDQRGIVVDTKNGQFAHSPLTRRECDTGYYLLWGHHQHQGLLQSKDLDKCCFFSGHALKWLRECDYFPENYFELWDIYDKYVSYNGKKGMETNRKNGTGLFDPEIQKKGMETNRKNGTAVFDPEVQKKGLESQRRNGTGIFDPEVQKKAHEAKRKTIELTKIETGEKFVFPSKTRAARTLNLNTTVLSAVCLGKRKQTGGFTARYL